MTRHDASTLSTAQNLALSQVVSTNTQQTTGMRTKNMTTLDLNVARRPIVPGFTRTIHRLVTSLMNGRFPEAAQHFLSA